MNHLLTPTPTFVLRKSPLAIGAILFAATFVMRSVMPMLDTIVLSITIALLVVVAFMFIGHRWAGLAFQAFPIALFTSPAGREFSFNLTAVDNSIWRWHAVIGLVSLGVSSVVAVYVMLGRAPRSRSLAATLVGGLAFGALMIAAISALYSHPGFGRSLSAETVDSLPVIEMVNYGYFAPDLRRTSEGGFAAVVKNPSNLPHTVTIDVLDIDLYVPAGRSSVLEITAQQMQVLTDQLPIYCTVGDHLALGMKDTLRLRVSS
jgi:hypothetical protein